MRSSAAKGLKADKPVPVLKPQAKKVEAPVIEEEVTKVDEKPVQKPVRRAKAGVKAPIRAVAPKLGLKVSAGLNMGTLYPVKKGRNIIGRRVDASFPVQDERASRDHASIEFKKGHFMLEDLKSTNGTFLNNKAVTAPIYIKEGDTIRVGSSVFLVESMSEKSPEMVERWSSMTTVVPRAQVMAKAKQDMSKPLHKEDEVDSMPRWKHLTRAISQPANQKHLHHARLFGMALCFLVVAAAILSSLH